MQDIAEDVEGSRPAGLHGDPGADTAPQDLPIEIRSRWPLPPAPMPELVALGVQLLGGNRLLRIHGAAILEPEHVAALSDPLAEEVILDDDAVGHHLDVFCRPGVTDAEGEMAGRALAQTGLAGVWCEAGTRYLLTGSPIDGDRPAIERLLGNPLIHRFQWHDQGADGAAGTLKTPTSPSERVDDVETIDIVGRADEDLMEISRRHGLALDGEEMRAVAAYFAERGRNPTDVELQSVALAWSEHCSHKTFQAPIDFQHDGRQGVIPGLLKTYLVDPAAQLNRPWVRSAFDDNAGIIAFDDRHDLAAKVETHNHPSALEPYGGAHTGVGGVIRDILAVSAEPIANMDVLCFGPLDLPAEALPAGVLHPRTTFAGVVRGVADYGNNMGIPTVGGAVLFHPGFTANPLVYCGTLGLAPRGSHPRSSQPGDLVVLLGGRTGRDGLHGATMSSATLDRESVAGSTVQIGAPITEKTVRDVIPRLRDERLYHAINDCGAGGLCSAVGEMGEDLGVEVDLERVPLKYQGLLPWEIWLSEAQERMVLAVSVDSLGRLLELCHAFEVEATVIGRFREDGLLSLRHEGREVGHLEMSFLHGGRPSRTLPARWASILPEPYSAGDAAGAAGALLGLLAHPNIASKESVIRRYDHEVQASTIVKPLVGGAGPSDAAVLRPLPQSQRGVAVAHGINPLYGTIDPHAMAMLAVDEALRNLVAVGGSIDHTALLDNFCWGDVDDPGELGALVRATQACRDATLTYRVPFISGKDSLRNTSVDTTGRHSIPGTLLITAVGVMEDTERAVTMDLKAAGNGLFLLGLTRDELGGSHYLWCRGEDGGEVPRVRPEETPRLMRRLTCAIGAGLVRSCHDLSEGGLAVAAAEMAIAGGLGLEIDLGAVPSESTAQEALLFAESPGRFLVEIEANKVAQFEALFGTSPLACIGSVTSAPRFVVRASEGSIIDLPLEEIDEAWRGTLSTEHRTSAAPGGLVPISHPSLSTGDALDGTADWDRGDLQKTRHAHTGVRALVLTARGINCDRETVEACERAGAAVEPVHINQLLDGGIRLADFGLLVLPGGFSYGDHLGAGAMLATILRHTLLDDLRHFIADGRAVLGICNGFQVLARLGLLGDVALTPNTSGRFECRWVPLRVEGSTCLFTEGLDELELPIAHGQGRLVVSEKVLPEVLTRAPLRYVENSNGSVGDVAGVCNAAGNVLGLMPHPERYLTPYHHPDKRRGRDLPPSGLAIFRNAVRYVREVL